MTARHPGGGKAKFLEDPLKAAVPGFDKRVADATMTALGGKA
jgi:hypothetical protein